MLPIRRIRVAAITKTGVSDYTLERDLQFIHEDIYNKLPINVPSRSAYAALTTQAEQIAMIAQMLGLM